MCQIEKDKEINKEPANQNQYSRSETGSFFSGKEQVEEFG